MRNVHTFAHAYDYLFPLNQEMLSFLNKHLIIGKVLDVGCGTGTYLIELDQLGYLTKGIDSDKQMVEEAKRKTKIKKLKCKFQTGDMLSLRYVNEFDGLICIGNTLVHAVNLDEARRIVDNMYQALCPNGSLVLQIINYDRITKNKIERLPLIQYPNVEFERIYEYIGDKIRFLSKIKVFESQFNHSVLLMPIKYDTLNQILTDVGFRDIVSHDGFTERPFDIEESMQLVFTCHK